MIYFLALLPATALTIAVICSLSFRALGRRTADFLENTSDSGFHAGGLLIRVPYRRSTRRSPRPVFGMHCHARGFPGVDPTPPPPLPRVAQGTRAYAASLISAAVGKQAYVEAQTGEILLTVNPRRHRSWQDSALIGRARIPCFARRGATPFCGQATRSRRAPEYTPAPGHRAW